MISPIRQFARSRSCTLLTSGSGSPPAISRMSFVLDGLREMLALADRHQEGAGAPDDAVAVVEVEVLDVAEAARALQHDRQAVDGDALASTRLVAGELDIRPLLFGPSPETSMTRRIASTPLVAEELDAEVDRARDRGAPEARPIGCAARRSAKASAPPAPSITVQGTTTFWSLGPPIPCRPRRCGRARLSDRVVDGGERNASTKPSRCRSCSSGSMERETSTASTRARSTSVSEPAAAAKGKSAPARPARRAASTARRRRGGIGDRGMADHSRSWAVSEGPRARRRRRVARRTAP